MADRADQLDATLSACLAGQYALERELGRGGMGVVYLARDVMLDRPVAIKVLPRHLAEQTELRERFLREARTAAQLSHPHIVAVYRADEVEGHAFFVMAYVDGESLADRVRDRGPLPAAEAVRWLREVAWALAYAHARGVIHRDVKPENIMIERGGGRGSMRALVTDFGIARDVKADALTRTGYVLGTVHYMSPEQVSGAALDGRSDLYALGVVSFYVLSGRLPFDEETASAVLVAHATQPAPPLASVAPGVPRQIAAVVDRCLEKDPDARYATGEELADALGRALAAAEAEAQQASPAAEVVLSDAQAAALWKRAAQLQAEALQRLDARAAGPALVTSGPAGAGEASREPTTLNGYSLRHVQAAALEAGISEQFIALALAELPRDPQGVVTLRESGTWQERRATKFLGTPERSCSASRVMRAPPRRVLQALGQVLQQHPFDLTLKDTVGGHPLDGGVLVFDLPGPTKLMEMSAGGLSHMWMGTRHQLEAEQVQVMLRALPSDPAACEVTMFVDLRPGVRRNVNAAAGLSAALGGLGAVTGAGLGLKALAVGALAGVSAVGAGALAALGTLAWYRWLYRSTIRKAEGELNRALGAVEASLRAEEVFGTAPPVRRGPPAAGRLGPGRSATAGSTADGRDRV